MCALLGFVLAEFTGWSLAHYWLGYQHMECDKLPQRVLGVGEIERIEWHGFAISTAFDETKKQPRLDWVLGASMSICSAAIRCRSR